MSKKQLKSTTATAATGTGTTTPDPHEALRALLRADLVAFVEKVFETLNGEGVYKPNWHIEAIVWQLLGVMNGETRRLAILMPPRHMKSIIVSVAFVAWWLGRDPRRRFLVVSHSEALAATLARQFRIVMESDWYCQAFPDAANAPRKNTEVEFETREGGGRLGISLGASITGRGGDVIIIDDPMKAELANNAAEEERVLMHVRQSLMTRLNDKKTGAILLVMQRLSINDLAAHFLEDPAWKSLVLPAVAEKDEIIPIGPGKVHHRSQGDLLHPAMEDEAVHAALRWDLGADGFAAQYQQAPVPPGGGMLKLAWFKRYQAPPGPDRTAMIFHSWDCAAGESAGASYSVFQKWLVAEEKLYLVDLVRGRPQFPELVQLAKQLIERDQPTKVIIEYASAGIALSQQLWSYYPPSERARLQAIRPKYSKGMRAQAASVIIERGDVLLPNEASWLGPLETELGTFPEGPYNDQVDALTQAVWFYDAAYLKAHKPRAYTIGGERRGRPISELARRGYS